MIPHPAYRRSCDEVGLNAQFLARNPLNCAARTHDRDINRTAYVHQDSSGPDAPTFTSLLACYQNGFFWKVVLKHEQEQVNAPRKRIG
jgi:hypothetical protein